VLILCYFVFLVFLCVLVFWGFAFSALTLLVGQQERHSACKKNGGDDRGSLDGVALRRMVGVSASVNLPLHHKLQKFSSGTDLPG